MKMPRFRFTMRRMMAAVAFCAVAVWVGMHYFPDWRESFHQWRINRPIWRQLDQKVTIRHPGGVTLSQLVKRVKQQTTTPSSPGGLTVYVDPIGIQDAGLDPTSVYKIDVQNVPLGDALDSVFKPMGLKLHVRDGIAGVTGVNEVAVD